MEASFIHRFMAYIIDILIITLISSTILMILPENKNVLKLNEELNEVTNSIVSDAKIDEKTLNRINDINYDLTKETFMLTIIDIAIALIYFVVIPTKNKGQTLGKRLLKIKIVTMNEEPLSYNNLLFRYLLINAILVNIISLIMFSLLSKNIYLDVSIIIGGVQSILMIITIIMVMFRKDKRGLHDYFGNTKVIYNLKEELVECKN